MEEKYSNEETKSIRTGIMATVIILLVVFITISHNASIKNHGMGDTYDIYASFGRTDGLNVGDAVRLSGVDIGRVSKAELDENFNSRLTLNISKQYKIPDDSSASIVSFGLIGGKYVEIEIGGSEEYIPNRGSISYTQDAIVLEELLERIIAMGKSKRNTANQTEDKGANDE
ncbi:MAG: MlaD family protein [Acetobacter sp.]|nr:MlaD family protein [Acetobacter sp.]